MKGLYRRIRDKKIDKGTLWLLTSRSDIIATYIVFAITKYNTPFGYDYWERRIHDFIPHLIKLRTTGAYPSVKVLRKEMIEHCDWDKDLHSVIDRYYKDSEKEELDIKYYDKEVMYNYVLMFFEWMIEKLSSGGYVDRGSSNNKLKEVIEKYNKEVS